MKHDDKQAVALWRLGVLGPLTSARLEHGDRRRYFAEAAARTHERPDGTRVQLSARTIEAWYDAYRRRGFPALFPRDREDRGRSRAISAEIAEHLLRVKRERPRRSIRRIIRMLERAGLVRAGALHRSTVHRLLAAQGVSARPLRGPAAERRSFLHEHAGDLWVGDALHGPLVIAPDGSVRKAYLLSQIDGATRYVPHSYFAVSESAVDQEYGFKQAIAKHGPPRVYYVDLGSAYIAESLVLICAELGIRLVHTGVQDCEAKGVIERWHRTWREEVGDELGDHPIPLADLNAKHWARLAAESGCVAVFVGMESISNDSLEETNKSFNQVKKFEEEIRMFHDHGIMVNPGMVFGFDHDDESIFERTVDWLIKNRLELAYFNIL
ncbi:MAG: DDE-type integrase/transposase/recombinase, partial [candidate division NC10 bacterium]